MGRAALLFRGQIHGIFLLIYSYALLPVIGFLVCIPQIRTYIPINSTVETIPDGSIKFLSYNVMGFNNLEKKEGKNPILSYLADSEADIICLQEYNSTKNKKSVSYTHLTLPTICSV